MTLESEGNIQNTNFPDLVTQSQKRWIDHANLFSIEQSRKLPTLFSQWVYNLVLDHLPDYIPETTRQQLRDTHPVPLMTIGMLRDSRFQEEPHEGSIAYSLPYNTPSEHILPLAQGLNILDEVVVDTLSHDVINSLMQEAQAQESPSAHFFAKVLSLAEIGHLSDSANLLGESTVDVFARVTTGNSEAFRRDLVKAAVTGDARDINMTLANTAHKTDSRVTNLDELAILLGGKLQLTYGTTRTRREESLRENISRSFTMDGVTTATYPGVIELIVLSKAIMSLPLLVEALGVVGTLHDWRLIFVPVVNALPSYMSLRSFTKILYTAIHEIAHYLCMDTNRRGLPIESHLG